MAEPRAPVKRSKSQLVGDYLVASARLGGRKAWAGLHQHWHGRFVAHARRLTGDLESGLDAVQEAWADIYTGLPRLKGDRAFAAWAYRIVTRKCIAANRKEQKRWLLKDGLLQAAKIEPKAYYYDGERRNILTDAIARLPFKQRAAIALYYSDGFSVAEIAVIQEIAVGTVKTRLMHGREKLKQDLNNQVRGKRNG